jgi:hypothetical protein
MTENIDLEKKKENLSYTKSFCESCSLFFLNRINFRFLVAFIIVIKDQDSDTTFSLWNAIFERINSSFSFWLEISDRKLNESESFNRIWTYFRLLVSIESISKQTFFWLHSIIFFHLRFHLIQHVLNQLFCFLVFVSDSLW